MGLEKPVLTFLSLACFLCSTYAIPNCAVLDPNEYYPFPHDYDCSRYYECHAGSISVIQCPINEYYNPDIQACDFQGAVNCINGTVGCNGVDIDYLPSPTIGDCHQYMECYEGKGYIMDCPPNYYFNSDRKICTDLGNSDCSHQTTPHPTCWGVRPGQIVLVADPTDCSRYFECNGATLTSRQCPPGFLFSESRQICDFAGLVTDCAGPTPPPDPLSTTPSNPGQVDPRCNGEPEPSYWSHPEYCQMYIECYNGNSYEMTCPSGLYFDEPSRKCVSPRDSSCGKTTPPPRTTPQRPTDWTPDTDCTYDGELLPYPGDCTKYYECALGTKVEMDCPPNLYWHDAVKECDYYYNSECKKSWLDIIYGFFAKRFSRT